MFPRKKINTDWLLSTGRQKSPVTQLVEHLADYPVDVIDACKLLRRYHVSLQDFARALQQLEHEHRE
jgi:hypothetical protein